MQPINFFNTYIADRNLAELNDVLDSTFLSEGKYVVEFEKLLESQQNIKNPVALNSGTCALHLALIVAGIGKGDEVIIPAQTFIATGLAVLMVGAVPVFADIEYETGNIDAQKIVHLITPKTKAIMPVHWGGYPCDMDALNAIAVKHNLLIIEDAAHAIGATYKNKAIGALSDYTCFSFQAIKHVTTGDGGALACKAIKDFERAMTLRWFGIDRKNSPVSELGERDYNLNEMGYKYHMNNFAAALGIPNLKALRKNLARRREIAVQYNEAFKKLKGITLFKYNAVRESAYWLYGFHVENRNEFIKKLNASKIPSSVVHIGINKNDLFSHKSKNNLPQQIKFDATQIHIPVHNELTDEQVKHIINSIHQGW
ncbi:UDP-4-amino-4,6-dideoxy-N-acetyl-beta-L-altrosamine transaminase [soil metagenome]